MVLSGMSTQEQMEDNLRYMENYQHLTDEDNEIIDRVRTIYQGQHRIPCTACRYCVDGCPAGIPIPDLFAAFNEFRQEKRTDTDGFEKAAECVECGQCEDICPQHLSIRELLKEVASTAK
jgi:predicted aldo/keto reductase-like oxidoreductase